VNIIGKSLQLKPGDEVLATNLEYGACDKAWHYYCHQRGARYVRQPIRLPVASTEDFIAQFTKGITAQTKLIFISHITSSTGLRLPIEAICAIAREKGIMVFVDGAHGPGQVPVDLKGLDVDIYTGACHKWMMAPKGCSFLYVRRELQHLFDPLVISWGYDSVHPSASQFQDYHQMQGTRDIAAFLTIPAAVKFMNENNWQEVSRACRKMVQENAPRFCELLKATPIAPVNDDFIAQLYSIPVHTDAPEALHQLLYEKYKIQVPVMQHEKDCYLRYSIQAFNTQDDLDKLYDALKAIGV
jgi:isopenicillin-N epimerase